MSSQPKKTITRAFTVQLEDVRIEVDENGQASWDSVRHPRWYHWIPFMPLPPKMMLPRSADGMRALAACLLDAAKLKEQGDLGVEFLDPQTAMAVNPFRAAKG